MKKRTKKTDEQKMLDRIERYWNGKGRSYYLNGDHFPIKVFKYGHSTPNWTFDTYDEFKAFWDKGEHEYGGWKHYPKEFHVYVDFLGEMLPKNPSASIVSFINRLPNGVNVDRILNRIMDADLKDEKAFFLLIGNGYRIETRPSSFPLESNINEDVINAFAFQQERFLELKRKYDEDRLNRFSV